MIVTNKNDISLEMAVWLLHDDYDFIDEPNYISATQLMKPIRHILLPSRIPLDQRIIPDVEDQIPSALGKTIHAGIEKAWKDGNHVKALKRLGIPLEIIKRVLVNPTPEELAAIKDPIPVYIEQRTMKDIEVDGEIFTIGGKFDLVCEGRVTDTKSTSVWVWIKNDRDENYQLQGSIYRWLNPDKITEDHMRINFVFTDWQRKDVNTVKNYPPRRVMHRDIVLLSLEETEAWIRTKIREIMKYRKAPEDKLPECTEEELWMSKPEYRFFLDPSKATIPGARSTRTLETLAEAQAYQAEKGGRGVIVPTPSIPKRCAYCAAFPICTQKDKYFPKEASND